jgi:hypothetical protein
MSSTHPPIDQNSWTPADGTKNTAEVAKTADSNMRAVRTSHDPQDILFMTKTQLDNLGRAVSTGKID